MTDRQRDPIIRVDNISKSFGALQVLRDVSMQVHPGETVSVLGKSGVGKSVLLKLIVGLLTPDSGEVFFEGKPLSKMKADNLHDMRKEIGFLFQGGALFDSMTVGENLNFLLATHTKMTLDAREARVMEALKLVGLPEKIDEMPASLSGGQRKRAGLARSIVLEPKLILYDEPTTGLDPITASSIAELILMLQTKLKVASIVVTHDLPTAYTISDRTIVLDAGGKIFDGNIEDMRKTTTAHLNEFLEAAELDRTRRERIIHKTI